MSDQQSKPESLDNSSLEDQSKKQIKLPEAKIPQTREERKFQQIIQRFQQQEKMEEIATLKRKRSKPNPKEEQQQQPQLQEEDQQPILLNPQIVSQQTENTINKLRINPKLRIKSQKHIYFYLSDCQDKTIEDVQKLTANATQLYSPSKYNKDQSNLNQINQDVQQETSYLIKNLKSLYQQQTVQQINSNEQKEFFNKFFDKKYIESILKESRNYKKIEKQKQIPKKY